MFGSWAWSSQTGIWNDIFYMHTKYNDRFRDANMFFFHNVKRAIFRDRLHKDSPISDVKLLTGVLHHDRQNTAM